MSSKGENDNNVVDMAEARKRQKTIRKGASGKESQPASPMKQKIIGIVQVLFFLFLIYLLMQTCGRH